MALVNPNIAMSYRQPDIQAPNALAQYAQIQQIQGGQQAQDLARFQLGAAQRAEATQNALADAYGQSVDPTTGAINYNKLTGLLAKGGGASQIPGIEKTRRELETAALTKKKTEQEIETGALTQQKMQTDLLGVKLKQSREFLDTIDPAAPDAPQRYLAWHEANHRDPVIGPALNAQGVSAEQARQSIMNAVNQGPQAFADLLLRSKLGTEKFMAMNAPQVVAPGASLVQGNKAVYTAPFAPEKPPAPTNLAKLQNELAALPPGDPRRAQYEALIRKEITPVAGTNITMVSEKAEQAARGARLDKQYDDISKAAGLAAKTLPAIEANLSALNKGFDTGFGKETIAAGASVLAALGVKDAAKFATDTQMFQSNAISAVLQKQLEQKGPQTESDAKRIEQIGAQLGKTKDANRFILDTAKEQLRRDMDQRNFYDRWYEANKTYNGAENAWFNGEGGKSLFDRPSLKKYNVSAADAAAQIPGNRPAPARAAPAAAPIYARNPQTNQRIMSTDGGNTWTPAR